MAGSGAPTIFKTAVLAITCLAFAAASAAAEDVPLPPPRAKTGTAAGTAPPSAPAPAPVAAPAPPAAASAPAPSDGIKRFFPFSFSFPFDKGQTPAPAMAFDANQRVLLAKISNYLSDVQTMVGNFVQIGPDGRRVDGTFWIQKPGKVRFQYNPPSPIDVIADGSAVAVQDHALETSEYYPLSQTPLRYLLADRIDLLRDTNVVGVSADDSFDVVVIDEKQLAVGTTRLTMMFDARSLQLKQWTVTDPQGLDTTVAVYNLDPNKKPDPNLFVINYQSNLK